MNRQDWFTTPIWYDYTDIDVIPIYKKCLQLKKKLLSRTYTNVGGWQSDDIDLFDYKEFMPLHNFIDNKLQQIISELQSTVCLRIDNAWININGRGNSNMRHTHQNAAFAGVFYVNVDDKSGDIKFYSENKTMLEHGFRPMGSPLFWNSVMYKPKNGMLLIFPSWIPHDVSENKSKINRVSISFNIKQI